MLLLCAALWGGSYLMAKVALRAISPQWLMFLRMLGACLIMLALFGRRILKAVNKQILLPGLLIGLTYYGNMILENQGLQTVEPGRSSFLIASYCVITPFAGWLVAKCRPGLTNVLAALICMAGVGFVSLKPGTHVTELTPGDIKLLGCAFIFAFNITLLGHYAGHFNPLALTFMQFAVSGVCFLVGALIYEPGPSSAWLEPQVLWSFLYLLIGATTAAQILQNIGLAHVPATTASLLECTECLFAVAFSVLFWGEPIGWSSVVGFVLIFSAVLMSVLQPGRIPAVHRMKVEAISFGGHMIGRPKSRRP
ncbi:EamA family transporter [Bifidobacterium aemilianum]|uniref:EamA family transporter n=2 Tax=Bifidobacterium aemilianum TaxID=2493120 RepID=A0A366KC85_9BIFI|nr:EamA family transporter [Bifidobacterium aemilianum]